MDTLELFKSKYLTVLEEQLCLHRQLKSQEKEITHLRNMVYEKDAQLAKLLPFRNSNSSPVIMTKAKCPNDASFKEASDSETESNASRKSSNSDQYRARKHRSVPGLSKQKYDTLANGKTVARHCGDCSANYTSGHWILRDQKLEIQALKSTIDDLKSQHQTQGYSLPSPPSDSSQDEEKDDKKIKKKYDVLQNGIWYERICGDCLDTHTSGHWCVDSFVKNGHICQKCYRRRRKLKSGGVRFIPNHECSNCSNKKSMKWFKHPNVVAKYLCNGCKDSVPIDSIELEDMKPDIIPQVPDVPARPVGSKISDLLC
ncbi:hypothetical protein HDV01_004750 [Terramyces sp. JEL0728]|nr:hypothetical protein HDV01_004750 [Terramyces sp. JEL0728]